MYAIVYSRINEVFGGLNILKGIVLQTMGNVCVLSFL